MMRRDRYSFVTISIVCSTVVVCERTVRCKMLVLAQLVLLISLVNCGRDDETQRRQVWRLVPENEAQLKSILDLSRHFAELDFWNDPTKVGRPVDVMVMEQDIPIMDNLIRRHGVSHRVMIQDVQKLSNGHHQAQRSIAIDQETAIENFNYAIYHPAENIESWMDLVVQEYAFVEKLQVGVTFEGRPIHALKILGTGTNKSAIYVDSLIHSREWITGAASLFVFKQILSNSSFSSMLNGLDWFFIPVVNVDGYMHTWTTNRLWRKTMSEQAGPRCQGTDPNRNFDDHWNDPQGSSSEPCSSTFRGPFAASESETRHVSNFIKANNDVIKAVVTLHSYAQVVIYPFNYNLGEYPNNNNEQNETAAAMSEAMYGLYQTIYEHGPAAETLVQCGSSGSKASVLKIPDDMTVKCDAKSWIVNPGTKCKVECMAIGSPNYSDIQCKTAGWRPTNEVKCEDVVMTRPSIEPSFLTTKQALLPTRPSSWLTLGTIMPSSSPHPSSKTGSTSRAATTGITVGALIAGIAGVVLLAFGYAKFRQYRKAKKGATTKVQTGKINPNSRRPGQTIEPNRMMNLQGRTHSTSSGYIGSEGGGFNNESWMNRSKSYQSSYASDGPLMKKNLYPQASYDASPLELEGQPYSQGYNSGFQGYQYDETPPSYAGVGNEGFYQSEFGNVHPNDSDPYGHPNHQYPMEGKNYNKAPYHVST